MMRALQFLLILLACAVAFVGAFVFVRRRQLEQLKPRFEFQKIMTEPAKAVHVERAPEESIGERLKRQVLASGSPLLPAKLPTGGGSSVVDVGGAVASELLGEEAGAIVRQVLAAPFGISTWLNRKLGLLSGEEQLAIIEKMTAQGFSEAAIKAEIERAKRLRSEGKI